MTNRTLRIFLSSPADVQAERERARAVVQRAAARMGARFLSTARRTGEGAEAEAEAPAAAGSQLTLHLIRWEDDYFNAARDFQSQTQRVLLETGADETMKAGGEARVPENVRVEVEERAEAVQAREEQLCCRQIRLERLQYLPAEL